MLATPVFDSALLGSVFEAVERRGHAIRYHSTLQCTREVEGSAERLNIDIANDVRLRLSIWDDGAFWFSITKPGPRCSGGWQINEQFDGRWDKILPVEFVARLEETRTCRDTKDILRVWHDQHLTTR